MKTLLTALFFALVSSQAVAAESPAWLKLLTELSEINSSTDNPEGLEKVRQKLIPEFAPLGFVATTHDVGNGRKVLSFERKDASPKLMLVGHIDTVFGKDSPFQKTTLTEDTLVGPGVIDMKGGIVLMLKILSEIKDESILRGIRVVLNDDEEVGSPQSAEKLKELARGLSDALIFEPGLANGGVITSHSGIYWFEISVKGRAAHAGLDFKEGLNACVALSEKLASISKLTDHKKKFTVSVGSISGGTKPNVVCENAKANVDMRYVDQKDLEATLKKIQQIVDRPDAYNPDLKLAPTAEIKVMVHIPSMDAPATQKLFKIAQSVAKDLKFNLAGEHVGYVSDANRLSATGINVLVGLGTVGEGAHTDHESMKVSSFEPRLRFDVELVQRILRSMPR